MSELRVLICDVCPEDAHTLAVERVQVHRVGERKDPPWLDVCAEHFAPLEPYRLNGRRPARLVAEGSSTGNAKRFRCDEHNLEYAATSGAQRHIDSYHEGTLTRHDMRAAYLAAHPSEATPHTSPRYRNEYRCDAHDWEGPGQGAAAHMRGNDHRKPWTPQLAARMRKAYDRAHP